MGVGAPEAPPFFWIFGGLIGLGCTVDDGGDKRQQVQLASRLLSF